MDANMSAEQAAYDEYAKYRKKREKQPEPA